jgi:hypothetical protein
VTSTIDTHTAKDSRSSARLDFNLTQPRVPVFFSVEDNIRLKWTLSSSG